MAKVLVTGASGFVGSHLAEALVGRGDDVRCLVRKTSDVSRLRPLGVRLVYGDVTDPDCLPEAVADVDVVHHVAGATLALKTQQFYRVNEQGVRNVARACAELATPPVLVVVSSLAAAGPAPVDAETGGVRLRTESDPTAPVSHYGRSKLAGEAAAVEFADRVPVTVVRPPIVLGEADRLGLEMFSMIGRLGVHVVPGLGQSMFSVIHVADLVTALTLAADRGRRLEPEVSPRGYYFAACDEHPTYAELGRMIATALGRRRVLVVPTPPRAAWGVAAANEVLGRVRRRPFYVSFDKTREIRAGSWLCSSEAANKELGFSVTTGLADRLRQTAQWYREHGWV